MNLKEKLSISFFALLAGVMVLGGILLPFVVGFALLALCTLPVWFVWNAVMVPAFGFVSLSFWVVLLILWAVRVIINLLFRS